MPLKDIVQAVMDDLITIKKVRFPGNEALHARIEQVISAFDLEGDIFFTDANKTVFIQLLANKEASLTKPAEMIWIEVSNMGEYNGSYHDTLDVIARAYEYENTSEALFGLLGDGAG